MTARLFTAFVLAGYLAAAFLPCPVPGSAEVSALRGSVPQNPAAAPSSRAHPGHASESELHAQHERRVQPIPHARHAQASHSDEHAQHEPLAAQTEVESALTLPCPCGCGDKAQTTASGGKLGPRVLRAAFEFGEPERAAPIDAANFAMVSRSTAPAKPVPILDFIAHI